MEAGVTAGVNKGEIIRYNPKKAYSFFDEDIFIIRYELRYTNRRLKSVQREFHYVEGKFHRVLMENAKDKERHSEEVVNQLRQEADFCMERFCNLYKFQQHLVRKLEDHIHADAESKELLHNFKSST